MQVQLVFPHQLFAQSELGPDGGAIYLIESDLFFLQYQFHQQKSLFHRATMKYYAELLAQKGSDCHYIEAKDQYSKIAELVKMLKSKGVKKIKLYDPCDYLLNRQLKKTTKDVGIELTYLAIRKPISKQVFIQSSANKEKF